MISIRKGVSKIISLIEDKIRRKYRISRPEIIKKRKFNVYYFQPNTIENDLGKAYNDYIELVPKDDDWICLIDADAMILTPFFGHLIYKIINKNPNTGLFTCITNRVWAQSQLYNKKFSYNPNIKHHKKIALKLYKKNYDKTSIINAPVSGVLMIFQKKTRKNIKFNEKNKIIDLDYEFSKKIEKKGYKIRLMKGVYAFHYYRFLEGRFNTTHLR